jgi:hypothetical protein
MIDINPIRLKDVRPMSGDGYAVEGYGLAIEGNDVFIEGSGYA